MRTYKSIERPSQVLGIDLTNLFVVMGFAIGSAIVVGLLGMVLDIPWPVHVFFLLTSVGLFLMFKYFAKNRPPGFVMGYVSYHIRQPHRLSIGLRPKATAKALAQAKGKANAKA